MLKFKDVFLLTEAYEVYKYNKIATDYRIEESFFFLAHWNTERNGGMIPKLRLTYFE